MGNLFEGMSENAKQGLKSAVPLLVIAALFLVVGKFSLSQIANLRSEIGDAENKQSILSNKLHILDSISKDPTANADQVLFALPKSNPTLQVVSQLKLLAVQNSLVLDSIRSAEGSSGSNNISSVKITFNVMGAREQVALFIKAIETVAPITFVGRVDITENAGLEIAAVSVSSFYAPLPKTLPSVTEAVTDLNASEKSMLSQVNTLIRPSFSEITTATPSGLNANPFGQ
jgi:Tfp pilus assembly protein PilO